MPTTSSRRAKSNLFGNHVSTYAARAKGDTWQYLGQTVSKNKLFLITRQDLGINKLEDVRKRKFGNRGRHPGLNTWLYLKQAGLDPDKDEVELVTEKREEDEAGAKKVKGKSLLNMVADRTSTPPSSTSRAPNRRAAWA